MGLSVLNRSRWLSFSGFEKRLDLRQPSVRHLAAQSDGIDHPMQIVCHARRKFRLLREHGGDGLDGAPLIEKQHQELLTHQLLEC